MIQDVPPSGNEENAEGAAAVAADGSAKEDEGAEGADAGDDESAEETDDEVDEGAGSGVETKRIKKRNSTGSKSSGAGPKKSISAIWQHPDSGAWVFVGDKKAAGCRVTLKNNGVCDIVNCTASKKFEGTPNFFEQGQAGDGGTEAGGGISISYCGFPIGSHPTSGAVLPFFEPMFLFVDKAIATGRSVLIHCQGGMHRSGTTAVAYLMHATRLTADDATKLARKRRPVIQQCPFKHGRQTLVKVLQLELEKRR